MSVLGRVSAAIGCAALTVLAQAVPVTPVAAEDDAADCAAERATRYVVLFDRGTPEDDAGTRARDACGDLTGYYPEIAVGVVTSADPRFTDRMGPGRAFSAQAERRAAGGAGNATSPRGERSVPVSSTRATLDPTDPGAIPATDRTDEQWDMAMIGADRARAVSGGSADVVVGVLDSGIDARHPDLADAVEPALSAGCLSGVPDTTEDAWAPTTSVHGTHVAGTIAAADDGAGVTGVAPGVRLASVKVIDDRGRVDPEAVVCGLMWAARKGFAITNSSFAVEPWALSCAQTEQREVVREALARATSYATSAGVLNVAAATNESVNLSPSPEGRATARSSGCDSLPAGLRDVVAVSAVDDGGVKAGYSSYGLGVVGLAAPGGDSGRCVLSTVPGGYDSLCGTSMAAPHVSGVAALLASARPDRGVRELRTALERQADPISCPTDYDLTGDGTQDAYCAGYTAYNGFYGHGMVDALAAVRGGTVTSAAG
ncbi:S8 family peptidase [Amycolatopsis antarctica]|uniref:S8 family peptidase n=1 Tax=Amycolatopsis antarctica TaxID=1854586 RepID=UPI002696CBE3